MEGRYHEIHRMLQSKKDDDKQNLNHDLVSDLRVFGGLFLMIGRR